MVHDGAGQGVERYEVSQHPCSLPARKIMGLKYGQYICCRVSAPHFFISLSEPHSGAD
jgi:hypothetical protein